MMQWLINQIRLSFRFPPEHGWWLVYRARIIVLLTIAIIFTALIFITTGITYVIR